MNYVNSCYRDKQSGNGDLHFLHNIGAYRRTIKNNAPQKGAKHHICAGQTGDVTAWLVITNEVFTRPASA
ncbi:hypothetical protein [Dickeya dadantii]|uniref:hypothetical protein n=1 Tax=Dickeya dadantii TaxID=204038 RepID=UPI0005780E39|nr:hypothetical protein [Dickeya dadantii]